MSFNLGKPLDITTYNYAFISDLKNILGLLHFYFTIEDAVPYIS